MNIAGIVGAVSDATTAVGGAIEADLQRAATVAGMGGSFQVDLEALYEYYNRLHRLYSDIGQHVSELEASAPPGDMQCGGAGGRIPGAAAAAEATALSSGTSGLIGALKAIQMQVSLHLKSLSDNYTAYMQADDDNARILTAAAHPELADGTPTKARPKGW